MSSVVDLHRQVSIEVLKASNALAIRTPKGQKDPGSVSWDPRTNSPERSMVTLDTVSKTNDNLGIHLCGDFVDVDIDTDNTFLMSALEHFLPVTSHVWGRKSRPRTHRLYEVTRDIGGSHFEPGRHPFLEKVAARPDLKMEIRGGELRSGRYSLMPGSVHPSGEVYTWDDPSKARCTPAVVSQAHLIESVRFACAAAVLAPYWVEGQRNELCQAICGFLFRAASYSDDIVAEVPLTKERARDFLEGLLEISDDDEHDRHSRLKTFDQTWIKGEASEPIRGAASIERITGDEDIIGLLYALLASTSDLRKLDELFERYAVMRNTTNVIDTDRVAGDNFVMNKEAFVFTLAGHNMQTDKGRVALSSVFINSLRRTVVDGIGLRPEADRLVHTSQGVMANIWAGWGIPRHEDPVSKEDVEPILDYLYNVVADGDNQSYVWTLSWMADIFQRPTQKPGTALVLVGKQGAGKSMLGERILRPIIGNAHSVKVGSVEKISSKFNSHLARKLLIVGEEVISTRRRIDANTLKDGITSGTRTIEMKGRDAFEMEDFARYMFTSNHETDAVNVESGDRRYTVLKVNPKYSAKSDTSPRVREDYWKWVYSFLEYDDGTSHTENLSKFHRYLFDLEYDRRKIRTSHDTLIKRANMQASSYGIDMWLLSLIEKDNPFEGHGEINGDQCRSYQMGPGGSNLTSEWPTYVSYSSLEETYSRFVRGKAQHQNMSSQDILRFFFEMRMIQSTEAIRVRAYNTRKRVRPFPSQESIRNYLEQQGYLIGDFGEDEDIPQSHTQEDF